MFDRVSRGKGGKKKEYGDCLKKIQWGMDVRGRGSSGFFLNAQSAIRKRGERKVGGIGGGTVLKKEDQLMSYGWGGTLAKR